jgi:hypothetical protein
VTIPEKSWSRFRDIFSDYVDKMKDGGSGGATGGGGGGAAAVTPTSSSVAADNSPGPSSGSHKSKKKLLRFKKMNSKLKFVFTGNEDGRL